MALQDLLDLSSERQKIGLSEERINACIPVARQYIAYFREYPDMFVDFMAGKWQPNPPEDTLKLFFKVLD